MPLLAPICLNISIDGTRVLTSHGEDADKEADGAARQHDLLLGVVAGWLLPRRPDPHRQDQHVEQDDRDHPRYVDHRD